MKNAKKEITRISIQVPSDIAEKIEEQACKQFIKKSQYILQATIEKLKNDKLNDLDHIIKR